MSQRELRRKAPYAPISNVREVLQRLRDRGLQVPVTLETLQILGIPEGNAPRTLQALKFLGLVADDGLLEEAAERLHRATTEEYPKLLEEIVRKAYAPVWEVADPAVSNEVQIADAFRQYDPAAQRPRMVTLFLGLCAEAGIISERKARASGTSSQGKRESRAPRREPNLNRRIASTGYTPVQFVPEPQRSAVLFSITEEDLTLLSAELRKKLWDALLELTVARVGARKTQPAPFAADFFTGVFGQKKSEEPPVEGEE